jgi:RND family efflux transporter MFP subunit
VIPALAVLLLGVYWLAWPSPEAVGPAIVEVRTVDFVAKITEVGEVRALESVTIRAQKDGPIAYLVPEGQMVAPGEILVRFDSSQQDAALALSRIELKADEAALRGAIEDRETQKDKLMAELARLNSEVQLAKIELDTLKKKPLPDEVEKARLELEKAELSFDQTERKRTLLPGLVEKGFITQNTLDEAEAGYLAAKAGRRVAQFNLDKVEAGATTDELEKANVKFRQARFALEKAQSSLGPQLQSLDASVEKAKANVERAKNQVGRAEAERAKTQIQAPRAGLVVYARAGGDLAGTGKVHPGAMAFAGQSLVYLPDMSTMVADTEVNEIDIGKVKLGDPVEVRLDAYPGAMFRGKVLDIGALATLKPSRSGVASFIKVFGVTVRLDDKDLRLKPGLTATLDIIVDRRADVITVPLSAVASRRGESVVRVANGGRFKERKVVLGPSNDQSVVVLEGLRPGERVRVDAQSGSL